MSNIIKFPCKSNSTNFIPGNVQALIDRASPEKGAKIEELFNELLSRVGYAFKDVALELPSETTEEEIKLLEEVITRRNATIEELTEEVLLLKTKSIMSEKNDN